MYRVVTSITEPDGDTYKQYVKDYEDYHEALAYYEDQTCSLRVIGHELVRMSDGRIMYMKGWLYASDSGNFRFRNSKPKLES